MMPELKEGRTIGSYRVIRCIGHGGMGVVYEVEHVRLGTRYALKTFTLEGEDVGLFRKRFLAEGRLLARLNHARIVRVHDMDITDGLAWFVMDLVLSANGQPKTLADVPRDGSVPEAQIASWYEDAREALAAVHDAGVIHRDIKLENLLLGADGHVRLADFGISKIADERLRAELSVTLTLVSDEAKGKKLVGTSAYLPPEMRLGRSLSRESDYYSLGVAFFRLLTGLWYAPGSHAFDLLSPFDRSWRRTLGELLAEDPAQRRLSPIRPPRHPPHVPMAYVLGLLLGLIVICGVVLATISKESAEADLSDFAIPDSIQ